MPLADFAGTRNWGYDGVLWYAPDSAYGRPDDLKALIDEAHLRGLMVFLDVVYNHFGPEGNYLGRYAPSFFTEAQTPWGSAIDYRVPRGARLRDRECAALAARLSLRRAAARCRACHRRAGRNLRCCTISAVAVGELAAETGRHIHLVLENDDNRASLLDAERGAAARQIPRAMERRLSPRLARAADRRDARLLRRLSALAAARTSRARSAPASSIRARPRAHRGGAAARRAERRACRRPPSSISCRTTTRSATARSATGSKALADAARDRSRARDHAAGADDADAVHGRGMGLESAVPVLLRFQGRSRRCRAQGPPQGIRRGLCQIWRRGSRSARRMRPFNPRCWIGTRASTRPGASGWRWCGNCSRSAGARSCPGSPARASARRMRPTTAC